MLNPKVFQYQSHVPHSVIVHARFTVDSEDESSTSEIAVRKRGCEGEAEASRFDHSLPRKRGAQPGNANNLKHGFYSRQFKGVIQHDLDRHSFTGLTDEITALRVFLRETLELIGRPTNEKHALDCLQRLSAGFYALSRLVRTQLVLNLSGKETNDLLEEAIQETLAEMRQEEADSQAAEQAAIERLPKYGINYSKFLSGSDEQGEDEDGSDNDEGIVDLENESWMSGPKDA